MGRCRLGFKEPTVLQEVRRAEVAANLDRALEQDCGRFFGAQQVDFDGAGTMCCVAREGTGRSRIAPPPSAARDSCKTEHAACRLPFASAAFSPSSHVLPYDRLGRYPYVNLHPAPLTDDQFALRAEVIEPQRSHVASDRGRAVAVG